MIDFRGRLVWDDRSMDGVTGAFRERLSSTGAKSWTGTLKAPMGKYLRPGDKCQLECEDGSKWEILVMRVHQPGSIAFFDASQLDEIKGANPYMLP